MFSKNAVRSDVCNDVILMPHILEVVRQHILGVVGNFTYFLWQI